MDLNTEISTRKFHRLRGNILVCDTYRYFSVIEVQKVKEEQKSSMRVQLVLQLNPSIKRLVDF